MISIFIVGLIGISFHRKNFLIILIFIEILLLSMNLIFSTFSIYLDDVIGQCFVVYILTVAAAESAIGISTLTAFYKLKNTIQLKIIKKNNFINYKYFSSI